MFMKLLVVVLIIVLIVQTLIYIYVSLIERPLNKQLLVLQKQITDLQSFHAKELERLRGEIFMRDTIIRLKERELIEIKKGNDDESTI